MADQMTRQEFAEYMTAFEQRLGARFDGIEGRLDRIDGRLDQHDRRFDGLDGRLDQHDRRFDDLDGRLDQHDRRFDGLGGHLDQHDRRFDGLDGQMVEHNRGIDHLDASLADLKREMKVQFEQTQQNFKFSLEAVAAAREVTENRFDKMSREQAVHRSDLERAIKSISVRTAHVEGQVKPPDTGRRTSSARRRRG